jgi:adenylyltransferase/sulfurtransferase
VGTIGIIDDDVVRTSNLQRQLFFKSSDQGEAKVACLQRTLNEINPEITIEARQERLGEGNIEAVLAGYDLIVDGTDNFDTRYLVSDYTTRLRKPLVSGSVLNFDGQVTVFKPYEAGGPCYRCLYPEKPPAGLVPSCTESAVFGPMVGMIGCMMAGEVIKEILGRGNLSGALIIYSALGARFEKINLNRRIGCFCNAG